MRILVVLPRFPFPLDKGDKLRAYHQIVELAKRHEIHLFALSHQGVRDQQLAALSPYCRTITVHRMRPVETCCGLLRALLRKLPLQVGYWTSPRALRAYRRLERRLAPDVVYSQMIRTMEYRGDTPARRVLDFQDALSLNVGRRMQRSHGLLRLILNYEYKALQRTEQRCLALFDATTVISPVDRDALNPDVRIVPNGVDTGYFAPANQPAVYTVVFTGNMSYAPNVDAACWLVNDIMPLVWARQPHGIRVLIAGADPKPAVRALASQRVTVSGRLPDIRTAYASARIFVAPMRIGSGMQNKLLEAMAMQLPCVTTSLAATPLGAQPWQHLLVGDTAHELADMILLLTVDELHDSIADSGHRFVLENYSWQTAVDRLDSIVKNS